MNFYEHTLVAKQDLSSAEIENIQKKYDKIINSSGKVIKIEKWGLLNFSTKNNSANINAVLETKKNKIFRTKSCH